MDPRTSLFGNQTDYRRTVGTDEFDPRRGTFSTGATRTKTAMPSYFEDDIVASTSKKTKVAPSLFNYLSNATSVIGGKSRTPSVNDVYPDAIIRQAQRATAPVPTVNTVEIDGSTSTLDRLFDLGAAVLTNKLDERQAATTDVQVVPAAFGSTGSGSSMPTDTMFWVLIGGAGLIAAYLLISD